MAQKLNVNTSIVDYLKSIGKDSSFKARAQLAVDLGIVKNIKDYKGTAQQNTSLLKKAKSAYSSTSAATTTPKADTKAKVDTKQADKPKADTKSKSGSTGTNVTTGVDSTAEDWTNTYTKMLNEQFPDGMFAYEDAPLLDAVSRPELRTSADLAALTGLTYDYNSIYDILMRSVDAAHDARHSAQDALDAEYYTKAATAQSTLAETLAQQQSQAIQTGANRGMQAANALSSLLGVSQQFAGGAGELAQQRAQIAKDYAQAQAQAGVNAMNQSTDVAKYLADLAKNIYSSDTSAYVGQLDYNAATNAANAQLRAQQMSAQASLAGNLSDIMNSYYSGQISLEQAKIASDAQIQSAKVYGMDAAAINAASQEAVARIGADASKYTADKNYLSNVYTADKNYLSNVYNANKNYGASVYNTSKNYDATVYNADTNAKLQREQASGAAITGLISSFNEGGIEKDAALSVLQGYRAMGMIDPSTYDAVANIFQPKPAVVPNAKDTTASKTNNNNTAANKQDATKSPSTIGGILDKLDEWGAAGTKLLDWLILDRDTYYYKHPEDIK